MGIIEERGGGYVMGFFLIGHGNIGIVNLAIS